MTPAETLERLQLQREVIELKSMVLHLQHRDLLPQIAQAEAAVHANDGVSLSDDVGPKGRAARK